MSQHATNAACARWFGRFGSNQASACGRSSAHDAAVHAHDVTKIQCVKRCSYMPSASAAAEDFLRRDSSRNAPERGKSCERGWGQTLGQQRVRTHGVSNFFRERFDLFVGKLPHAPALQRAEARLQGLNLLPKQRNIVQMLGLFEGHAKSVMHCKTAPRASRVQLVLQIHQLPSQLRNKSGRVTGRSVARARIARRQLVGYAMAGAASGSVLMR